MYKGEIPFDRDSGQPMYYPQNKYEWKYNGEIYPSWFTIERQFGKDAVEQSERITVPPTWNPNAPFDAKMHIEGFSRGRSAANFDVVDENGIEYTIFMTDMITLLQEHSVVKGWTEKLTWSFCKRGQNYGVRLHT